MTFNISSGYSENKIFLLSALGSLFLHGGLISLLALLPHPSTIEDSKPTIRVNLVETHPEIQTNPSIKPLSPSPSIPSPPSPAPIRKTIKPLPPDPIYPSLKAFPSVPEALLPPPTLTPSTLKDTRTAKALKARTLMKMARSIHAGQVPQSRQPTKNQKKYVNPAMLPSNSDIRQRKIIQAPR